jgi:hypothetical protein
MLAAFPGYIMMQALRRKGGAAMRSGAGGI